MSSRQTGIVKMFKRESGYGFIKPDDGSRDVFVHISALNSAGIDDLGSGDRVEFDTEPSRKEGKGPQAVNLRVLA